MQNFKWIKEVKAVGWDLDGTLYPHDCVQHDLLYDRQIRVVAKEKKLSFDSAEVEYAKVYDRLGSNTKTLNHFGIDGLKFFTSFWDEIDLEKYIRSDQRVVQLIKQLNNNFIQFIISNSNRRDQIEKKLKLIGFVESCFDLVVSTVELGSVKPDPKPFLVALEKLQLKPEEVLFVGDRVTTDVMGAKGVGMKTCLVGKESKEADVSVKSVYDVGTLLV